MNTVNSPSVNIHQIFRIVPSRQKGKGKPFRFGHGKTGKVVKKMCVWALEHGLGGINIVMSDGSEQTFGTADVGAVKEFTFQPGERIEELSLWGNGEGTRTGWIKFTTNKQRTFDFGMTSWEKKKEFRVDTGSGIFVGIKGQSGKEINALGFMFLKPISHMKLKNVTYPTLSSDMGGIAPATLDSLDDTNSGTAPRNWTFGNERTVMETREWSVTAGLEVHAEVSVEGGIPEVAKVGAKAGWTVNVSGSYRTSDSDSRTLRWGTSGTLAPGESISLRALIEKGDAVDLDYTGTMEVVLQSGQKFSYPVSGTYKGVSYTTVKVTNAQTGEVLSESA